MYFSLLFAVFFNLFIFFVSIGFYSCFRIRNKHVRLMEKDKILSKRALYFFMALLRNFLPLIFFTSVLFFTFYCKYKIYNQKVVYNLLHSFYLFMILFNEIHFKVVDKRMRRQCRYRCSYINSICFITHVYRNFTLMQN